ncbi:MAG: UDP-N-acetylmuramate dehydrogenase [Defluviitaleaceae bacterium]|nr:UDP-N-acetylmuramate dehydrogenase [Defluviitaleaceae bacterium]
MTVFDEIAPLLSDFLTDEPMKNHTSFRIGGAADILAMPKTSDELIKIFKFCEEKNFPLTILGDGANVLVSDEGIRGVVVFTNKMKEISVRENKIFASAGARLSALAEAACVAGLAGLEFASGIPGTVGGAIFMNAGAFGFDISNFCEHVTLFYENKIVKKSNAEMEFAYRKSFVQRIAHEKIACAKKNSCEEKKLCEENSREENSCEEKKFREENSCVQKNSSSLCEILILDATFSLLRGEPELIREKMRELNGKRKNSQPLEFHSAGSFFKRPEGHYAGKLIEVCGLKGFSVGDAQVSEKHAGFVINRGNATAKNILELMHHVQKTVYEKFGVHLEPEVQMLGF